MFRPTRIVATLVGVVLVALATAVPAHARWTDRAAPAPDAGALNTGQVAITDVGEATWTLGGAPFNPATYLANGNVLVITVPVTVLATGTTMTPTLDVGWAVPPTVVRSGLVTVDVTHTPFGPSPTPQTVDLTVTVTVGAGQLTGQLLDLQTFPLLLDSGRTWTATDATDLGLLQLGQAGGTVLCPDGRPPGPAGCGADNGQFPDVTQPPQCIAPPGTPSNWVTVQQMPELTIDSQTGYVTQFRLVADFTADDVSAVLRVELPKAWFDIATASPLSGLRLFVDGVAFERDGYGWTGAVPVGFGRTALDIRMLFSWGGGGGSVYLYPTWMLATLRTTSVADGALVDTYTQAMTATAGYARGSAPNTCSNSSGWGLPPGSLLNPDGTPRAATAGALAAAMSLTLLDADFTLTDGEAVPDDVGPHPGDREGPHRDDVAQEAPTDPAGDRPEPDDCKAQTNDAEPPSQDPEHGADSSPEPDDPAPPACPAGVLAGTAEDTAGAKDGAHLADPDLDLDGEGDDDAPAETC